MLVTNSNRLSILSCCCSLVFFRLGWRRFFFITWSHFLSTLRIPNFLALSTGKEDILFAHSVNQLMCFFWSICDNDLWEVTLLIRWWIICCWDASVRLCDCVSWYRVAEKNPHTNCENRWLEGMFQQWLILLTNDSLKTVSPGKTH